jgi:hypothetical protein
MIKKIDATGYILTPNYGSHTPTRNHLKQPHFGRHFYYKRHLFCLVRAGLIPCFRWSKEADILGSKARSYKRNYLRQFFARLTNPELF